VSGSGLIFWTVYENPSDFPGKFVVRRSMANAGVLRMERAAWFVGDTLEDARASIPQHLHQQPREPDDDPPIVEVWF
jgi:hypothetical protein